MPNIWEKKLIEKGFELSTGGTENHLLLVKLRNFGITGSKMEKVCEFSKYIFK